MLIGQLQQGLIAHAVCLGLIWFGEGIDLDCVVVGGCQLFTLCADKASIFVLWEVYLLAAITNREQDELVAKETPHERR